MLAGSRLKMKGTFCSLLLALVLLVFGQKNCLADDKVTTTVNVNVPVVVKLSGTDNITTMQTLNLDSTVITFDSNLTASGRAFVTWRGNTNSNKGFKITVQRGAITGTGTDQLKNDVLVYGEPLPGGDTEVTIASPYVSGVPLTKVPDTLPDTFCSTTQAGAANFNVKVTIQAPSTDGTGNVNTILTFVAAVI